MRRLVGLLGRASRYTPFETRSRCGASAGNTASPVSGGLEAKIAPVHDERLLQQRVRGSPQVARMHATHTEWHAIDAHHRWIVAARLRR